MIVRRTPNSMSGYTLLELLVVLAMIGLVAALAAPLVGTAIASATINADTRTLVTYLRAQKQLAQSLQQPIAIDGTTASHAAELSGQAKLSIADAPLEYFPDGTTSGGRIILREYGQTRTVIVAWLTGGIAIGDTP
jgi:general secretion pathway protein H